MKSDLLPSVPDGYDCSSDTTLKRLQCRPKDFVNPPANRFVGGTPHRGSITPVHREEPV